MGGLRVDCQFGGEAWNLSQRKDDTTYVDLSYVNLNNGLKNYWNALTFGGSDPNDGDFKNTEGNHVGSWHGCLSYRGKGWNVKGYFEHQFDDHSQLFWQYGWKDMKWGIEAQLPKNPFFAFFSCITNSALSPLKTKQVQSIMMPQRNCLFR